MLEKDEESKKTIQEWIEANGLPSELFDKIIVLFDSIFSKFIDTYNKSTEQFNQTIQELNKSVGNLTATVIALQEKNNKNSSNSNKPSSWDHFDKPKPKPSSIASGDKKKRKTGGQPGHNGTTMKISAVPDKEIKLLPTKCLGCSHLAECMEKASEKSFRTVVDLEVKAVQTKYSQMSVCCMKDGISVCGEYPPFVKSNFQYGPMVNSMVTALSTECAVGMDKTRAFMNSMFGISMTDGTVDNIIKKASDSFADLVGKFKNTFSSVHVGHFDETGCRFQGKNAWLHIATSKLVSVFDFSLKRGTEGTQAAGVYELMKDPSQVAVTDFWSSYLNLDGSCPKKHAFCCAHIDRELQNLIDNYGNPICARKMKKLLKYAYIEVQKLKKQGITNAPENLVNEIIRRYDKIVNAALNKYDIPEKTGTRGRQPKGKIRCLFERLKNYKDGVLMFVTDFEVPFSNNNAERGARAVKTKEKVSGCFRGKDGPQRFCNIKSVMETCKKQGIRIIDVLKDSFSGIDVSTRFAL